MELKEFLEKEQKNDEWGKHKETLLKNLKKLYNTTTDQIIGDEGIVTVSAEEHGFQGLPFRFKTFLDLKNKSKTECFLSGGCLRAYFGREKTNDIDIYFNSKEEYLKFLELFVSVGAKYVYHNKNAIRIVYKHQKYDLICLPMTPKECVAMFDFTVSCISYTGETIHYHKNTFIDLSRKQLIINRCVLPLSTLQRTYKYYRKGYRICTKSLEHLQKQIIRLYPDGQGIQLSMFSTGID